MSGRSLDSYDKTNGQAGLILPGYGYPTTFANLTLTAGRLYAIRFVPSKDMTVSTFKFILVTAAGSNDTCDVGIADSTGSVLRTAGGAVAGKLNGSANSVQSVSLSSSLALTGGSIYYANFSCVTPFGGTAAAILGPAGTNPMGDMWGTAIGAREVGVQSGVGATIGGSITLTTAAGVPYLLVS